MVRLSQGPIPAISREGATQLRGVIPRRQFDGCVGSASRIRQTLLQVVAGAELVRLLDPERAGDVEAARTHVGWLA